MFGSHLFLILWILLKSLFPCLNSPICNDSVQRKKVHEKSEKPESNISKKSLEKEVVNINKEMTENEKADALFRLFVDVLQNAPWGFFSSSNEMHNKLELEAHDELAPIVEFLENYKNINLQSFLRIAGLSSQHTKNQDQFEKWIASGQFNKLWKKIIDQLADETLIDNQSLNFFLECFGEEILAYYLEARKRRIGEKSSIILINQRQQYKYTYEYAQNKVAKLRISSMDASDLVENDEIYIIQHTPLSRLLDLACSSAYLESRYLRQGVVDKISTLLKYGALVDTKIYCLPNIFVGTSIREQKYLKFLFNISGRCFESNDGIRWPYWANDSKKKLDSRQYKWFRDGKQVNEYPYAAIPNLVIPQISISEIFKGKFKSFNINHLEYALKIGTYPQIYKKLYEHLDEENHVIAESLRHLIFPSSLYSAIQSSNTNNLNYPELPKKLKNCKTLVETMLNNIEYDDIYCYLHEDLDELDVSTATVHQEKLLMYMKLRKLYHFRPKETEEMVLKREYYKIMEVQKKSYNKDLYDNFGHREKKLIEILNSHRLLLSENGKNICKLLEKQPAQFLNFQYCDIKMLA